MVRFAQLAALILVAAVAFADPEADVRCQEIAFSQSAENKDIEVFRSFLDGDTESRE